MKIATREELLDTLEMNTVDHRLTVGGAWVRGRIAGHWFEALVFAEPAAKPAWEVTAGCRMSKLWLKRIEDGIVVYNWDRGEDIGPRSEIAGRIIEILADGLAHLVWNCSSKTSHPACQGELKAASLKKRIHIHGGRWNQRS